MKKALIFFLSLSVVFGAIVQIGNLVVFQGGDGMSFKDVLLLTRSLSYFLEYDDPIVSKKGRFTALHFSGKTIIFDGKRMILAGSNLEGERIPPKDILNFFYVPYTQEGSRVIIPESVVLNIKMEGNAILVDYIGNPSFVYRIIGGLFTVVSTGYVKFLGDVYPPSTTIYTKMVGRYEIGKVIEEPGRDVVQLVPKKKERKLLIVPYGSSAVKPIPPGSFGVVLARGEGSVIVRPRAPELSGLDDEPFKSSMNLAEKLASSLGYKLEICPVLKIPPASPYVLVLLRDEGDFERIKKIVKELSGVEKVVDFTTDFLSLPDLGPKR